MSCPKLCLLVLLVVQSPIAYSASWLVSPRVTTIVSYVDNIDLSSASSPPSAVVLQLNPGFTLQKSGRRLSAYVDYQLQNLFYSYDGALDDEDTYKAYQQVTAHGNSELVKKLFFIDVGASYSQQNAFGSKVLSFDNLSLSSNRSNVKTVSVSPYLQHRFGLTANVELRTRFDRYTNDLNAANNADIRQISLLINSGTRFDRLGWSMNGSRKEVDNKVQQDRTFTVVGLRLTYKLASRISLLASAGHEKDEYKHLDSATSRGSSWTAGIQWNPSKRTDLSAEVGRRYYGHTGAVTFNHHTKHTIWSLGYTEDITDQSLIQTEMRLVQIGVTAPSGGSPGGEPVYADLPFPVLATGTILRRTGSAGLTIDARKSSLKFHVSQIKYDYQLSDSEEKLLISDLSWQWNASSKVKMILTYYDQLRTFYPSNQDELLQQVKVNLQRIIRKNIQFNTEYRHTSSSADNNLNEYTQNAIDFGITAKF